MPGLDLLGNRDKVVIPFDFYYNFMVVDVLLRDALPLKFIFDTGAENTILFERTYTDLLGIPYDKSIQIYGADLSRKINALIARRVLLGFGKVGEFTTDLIVLEEDLYHMERYIGVEIDGVIGSSIFCGLTVSIDYRKGTITLERPEKANLPKRGFKEMDIKLSIVSLTSRLPLYAMVKAKMICAICLIPVPASLYYYTTTHMKY